MMGPFDIAANDQSVFYLNYIFGTVGSVLTPIGASEGAVVIGIMSVLFKALNTAVLTLGVVIVIYTTVLGLLATAHEGEFMGKKWSGPWVPLRTIFGIALMFPVSSGYSAIQIIVMWIILQGVGAADVLWNTVINYVRVAGSVTATISVSATDGGNASAVLVPMQMQRLFEGLVCQASARAADNIGGSYGPTYGNAIPGGTNYYYCTGSGDSFCAIGTPNDMYNLSTSNSQKVLVSKDGSFLTYSMGPGGYCGTLQYDNPNMTACTTGTTTQDLGVKLKCAVAAASQKQLQTIVYTLGAIAEKFVQLDHQYINFYDNKGTMGNPWINSYCSQNGVSADGCCLQPPVVQIPAIAALWGAQLPTGPNCTTQQIFSADYDTPSNTGYCAKPPSGDKDDPNAPPVKKDFTNTCQATLNNIYVPYGFHPYLGGDVDFTGIAAQDFLAAASAAVANVLATSPPAGSDAWTQASNNGWLLAGGYYYTLASSTNNSQKQANPTINVQFTGPSGDMTNYRNNYNRISELLGNATESNPNAPPIPQAPGLSGVGGSLGALQGSLLNSFIGSISQGLGNYGGGSSIITTPLENIAKFGFFLMTMAQVCVAIFLIVIFVAVLIGKFNFIALGFGMTEAPWGAAIQSLVVFAIPLIMALIGSLFVLGALLGIYVPLIPYIVFTMGAIGWFIAVIEAMVAAPLVAIGIISPHGHHEFLGRSEQAIFMLLNLFLRPGLMIIGMIASMLLAGVVVTMINSGFMAVVSSMMGATTFGLGPGLFEQIVYMAVYTMLIITALNKVFSLIYVIPERVTTWIGGHAVQYGEGEALGQVKQGAEGAAHGIAQATGAGASMQREGLAARGRATEGKKGTGGTVQPGGGESKENKPEG